MCLEKPGPRCSNHTRINFRKASAVYKESEADLKQKKQDFEVAQSVEAKAALEASEQAHAVAVTELQVATVNYDAAKVKRADAMNAYRKARDEYNASPEGIRKNREKSINPNLSDAQRDKAFNALSEGKATRDSQKEAYAIQQLMKQREEMLAGGSSNRAITPVYSGIQSLRDEGKGHLADELMKLGDKVKIQILISPSNEYILTDSGNKDLLDKLKQNPADISSLTESEIATLRSIHIGQDPFLLHVTKHEETSDELLRELAKTEDGQDTFISSNANRTLVEREVRSGQYGFAKLDPDAVAKMGAERKKRAEQEEAWEDGIGTPGGWNPSYSRL